MKKRNLLLAVGSLFLSTTAWALPTQVPQIYYDKLPHREGVLAGNPGFCGTPIAAFSRICIFTEDF